MRRNLVAPVVVSMALAAGCGGTRWDARGPAPTVASAQAAAASRQVRKHPSKVKPKATPTTAPKHKLPAAEVTPRPTAPKHPTTPPTTNAHAPSATIAPTVQSAANGLTWVAYTDASGVTLLHPTTWTVQAGRLGPLVVSIDGHGLDAAGYRRNINMLEQPLADGLTPADYERATVKRIAQTGGTIDDRRAATLSGAGGRQMIWHIDKAGTSQRFLTVWVVRGRVAFVVTYASDQRNFATPLVDVRRLISSIRLPPIS